jgi:hypothetical protein
MFAPYSMSTISTLALNAQTRHLNTTEHIVLTDMGCCLVLAILLAVAATATAATVTAFAVEIKQHITCTELSL